MMHCPECGGEYRDGFTECADCGVALVAAPPPAPPEAAAEDSEMVTVLELSDPAEIALVESLFIEAEIPYFKQGDGVQDLFGIGRLGGFNVLTGPAHILVPREHVDAATELLRDMPLAAAVGPQAPELSEEPEPEPGVE